MENLQEKYNSLLKKLDNLKVEQIKVEAQLEQLTKEKEANLKELLTITESKTLEEAEAKTKKLEEVLAEELAKAEKILNEL